MLLDLGPAREFLPLFDNLLEYRLDTADDDIPDFDRLLPNRHVRLMNYSPDLRERSAHSLLERCVLSRKRLLARLHHVLDALELTEDRLRELVSASVGFVGKVRNAIGKTIECICGTLNVDVILLKLLQLLAGYYNDLIFEVE